MGIEVKKTNNNSPFISLIALIKSFGSLKLTNPYPFDLLDFLSRIILAFRNDGYLEKALVSDSSVTSLPRSPQNIRKSSIREKKTSIHNKFLSWDHSIDILTGMDTEDSKSYTYKKLNGRAQTCTLDALGGGNRKSLTILEENGMLKYSACLK